MLKNQFEIMKEQSSSSRFYSCTCYLTHNIYIKEHDKHFVFINEDQFKNDYKNYLLSLNCTSEAYKSLKEKIIKEIDRRKSILEETEQIERRELIKNIYIPLDSFVYKLEIEYLEQDFLKLVIAAKNYNYQEVLENIHLISAEKKIYGFPLFKPEFCFKFLKELQHFEESDLPKERPNTMNNYGILLDDLDCFHEEFSFKLRTDYLDPLSEVLFPEHRGQGLDSHKIFTVGYKFGQDTELGYHYDNSEVTLNVCLGKQFTGGDLYFGDMRTTPVNESSCILVSHNVGYGVLHRGQQMHGTLPVTSGERHNLIMWMRSSSIRNSLCPMCQSEPKLKPSSDYGDGFTRTNACAIF